MGDMRLFSRFYAAPGGPLFTWVLVRRTKDPKVRAKTWTTAGTFAADPRVVSQFDIMDFAIGEPPKGI